ncbi:hypothetical protein OO010_12580 [Flavobacteriaceae bacterium KMM 6898]|nr:hypothetical protein [Flavobacteriaceae bacterium KMM 6898]
MKTNKILEMEELDKINLSKILGGKVYVSYDTNGNKYDEWDDRDNSGTISSGDVICYPDTAIK